MKLAMFRKAAGSRQTRGFNDRRICLRLEALEDRFVPSITDMTGVAQIFPRHATATVIYLNFDGNTAQGVSPFKSTTGNLTSDVHEIIFRVSQFFAPFDVKVQRIYGNGSMDASASGNSTIFIGDNANFGAGAGNIAGNVAHGSTPFANSDWPGDTLGITHAPNSNPFDIAFVDPVYTYRNPITGTLRTYSWNNAFTAQVIAHEAGHTFGLAHVLSSPDQEMMSYDAANVRFFNKTFNITSLNNNGTTTAPDSRVQPKWYTTLLIWGGLYRIPVNITTQNSYTYLQATVGARTTGGDLANVADRTAVDASYVDAGMSSMTTGFALNTYIQRSGDFDVYALSTPYSQQVQIDVKQLAGSTVDPVVMVFDGTGRNLLAFNDDGGGYPNSRLIFSTTAGQSYKVVVGSYGGGSYGGYQISVANYYYGSIVGPYVNVSTTLQSSALTSGSGSSVGGAGSGQAGSSASSFETAPAVALSPSAVDSQSLTALATNLARQLRGRSTSSPGGSLAALDLLFGQGME